MQTKKSKAFLASFSFLLLLAAFTAPTPTLASGGGDECEDMSCNSFFAPEVIQNPSESPFFRTDRIFYQHAYDVTADQRNSVRGVNLTEWTAYFDGKIKIGTMAWLLYKMPSDDLANLISVMNGKEAPLSKRAQVLKRVFDKYGNKQKVVSSLEYLAFAKKVEPIATRRSSDGYWNGDDKSREKINAEDREAAKPLITEGTALRGRSSGFLAERFDFQVARLLFFTGQYEQAQAYYEGRKDSFSTENSAKYRFIDIGAGAYNKQKQYGKANYLYSVVFDRFPALKRNAFYSFHPVNDSDWKESLSLARNSREKEVLWQMLGIYADGLAAIDQIYAINPKSPLLPLLLVREVNKAEEDWSANASRAANALDRSSSGVKKERDAVGVKRLDRLKQIADAGNTLKPYLWNLSVGHLMALAGDARGADHYLRSSLNGAPSDPVIRGQVRVSMIFNRVHAMKGVEQGSEDALAKELTWLHSYQNATNYRAQYLNYWALASLSKLYKQAGDFTRSLMLTDDSLSPAYRDVKKVDAIMEFQKHPRSNFDKFLVKNYSYTQGQLLEVRALNSLYKGNFKAAVEALKQAPKDIQNSELAADPFLAKINDCHDCDFDAPHTKYTKLSFAEKMLKLSEMAKGTGQASADASFQLATGFYNMSYYGNGRAIYDTAHGNFSPVRWEKISDADMALNQDMAERFYNLAESQSPSKEFKAKAVFMAAKAEQNRYYNTHPTDWNYSGPDIHPGKYYKQLKDSFADTEYYKEIIEECGYFKKYLGL